MALILALILTTAAVQEAPVQRQVTVEVFPILDLPITIAHTALIKTKDGYLLKCQLSNNSEFRVLGLRYALAVVDSMNTTTAIISKNEGLTLAETQTKNLTFKTPIKLKIKSDERLVLMLEQVISTDYVWDVIKSSEVLRVYLTGDYSTAPRVLRSLNQVDAPPRVQVIP
jgi:predicted secreted protein